MERSSELRLLDDDIATMRLGAAWLLGTLTQNNPKAQAAILGASAEIVVKLMASFSHAWSSAETESSRFSSAASCMASLSLSLRLMRSSSAMEGVLKSSPSSCEPMLGADG